MMARTALVIKDSLPMPCGQKIGCTMQGKLTLPGVFDAALMWNQSIMCYGPVMLIAWYWIACAELGLLWNHPTRRFSLCRMISHFASLLVV